MKVRDLIIKLSMEDGDAEVYARGADGVIGLADDLYAQNEDDGYKWVMVE